MITIAKQVALPTLKRATQDAPHLVGLLFEQDIPVLPDPDEFRLVSVGPPKRIIRQSPRRIALEFEPLKRSRTYKIKLPDGKTYPLLPDGLLDRMVSDKPFGLTWTRTGAILRLYAPRARRVTALFYTHPGEKPAEELDLEFNETDNTWEVETQFFANPNQRYYYGYRVLGPVGDADISRTIFADPYSWAVCKRNSWRRESLTVVMPRWVYERQPAAGHVIIPPRDLVIYESHVKDFSVLAESVHQDFRGTYPGAVYDAAGAPIRHIRELGITAIEWLPLADYDFYEFPYNVPDLPVLNTWNPFERNHWGYMPAYWFAPEARYATGQSTQDGDWIGVDGRQVLELREMIRKLHEAGIAVLVDVVYNHVAQYGQNPIRQVDPFYSLRHSKTGRRVGDSGCGNDLATERPMMRRLIVESLKHWVRFYGVDGFRFDLAGLIDEGTLDAITVELKKELPQIHLIAEPWGGYYDKQRFSKRDWASWNDLFRDGIKGWEPGKVDAFLFGKWRSGENEKTLVRHASGNLWKDGGPFKRETHTVNFLACHDGYTLGDYVRLAGDWLKDVKPKEREDCYRLPEKDWRRIRLGLFVLLTSRGPAMIHQGDEWGFAKWVDADEVSGLKEGKLDHDSYNKDTRTNWLDWDWRGRKHCKTLYEYTQGLIALRKHYPALRIARRDDVDVMASPLEFAFGYRLKVGRDDLMILMNGDQKKEAVFNLPRGRWLLLANHHRVAVPDGMQVVEESVSVPSVAGVVLLKM